MRKLAVAIAVGVLGLGLGATTASGDVRDEYWPNWRGPNADGVAVNGNPPITWSESKNIKWKIPLVGSGQSTPVVWEDKMFLQTAVQTVDEPEAPAQPAPQRRGPPRGSTPTVPYKFNLVCIDRHTGKVIWERTTREEVPHEGHHPTGSLAAYSPVTDGKLVWASFGSRGLHCYDLDGNHKWSTDLIKMRTRNGFGEGSSPALVGDAIVVVMDHEGDSKIFAFNKDTGKLLWQRDRDEITSWSTPLAVEVNGSLQVVTTASKMTRSYDVKTGDLIWECGGLTANVIPSPVTGFGKLFTTSGYRGYSLQAIELGHTGDLTDSDAIAWEINRGTPYVASPLLYDNKIYVTKMLGAVLSCYEADTGKPVYVEQRLVGLKNVYASLVGAAGRVYIMDRYGKTAVVKHADKFKVLATNTLDDGFDASPVVIGDELYLRGNSYLYCISEQ